MKKQVKLLALLSMVLVTLAFAQVTETQVIDFSPSIPKKPVKQGVCLGSSITVPRFGAWVCAADRESYDPCFSDPTVSGAVVCGADPAQENPGFRLELMQLLPAEQGLPPLPDEAWMMRLENGLVCKAVAGPQRIINQVGVIGFICDEPGLLGGVNTGLLKELQVGSVWQAHLVRYTVQAGEYQLKDELLQLPLETVWR